MKKTAASALLKAVAKPAPEKKSKSDVPVLEGFEALADQLNLAVSARKEAEGRAAMAESELLPEIRKEYLKRAKSGAFVKSFDIPGSETGGVQLTWQDKFSDIPVEHEDELRALDPRFDEHFVQKRNISLRNTDVDQIKQLLKLLGPAMSDIFSISLKKTDDATIEMLAKKLGEDFAKTFDITLSLQAKEGLDRSVHEIPDAAMGFVKQAKASVKVK